jgi:hypothetical protein
MILLLNYEMLIKLNLASLDLLICWLVRLIPSQSEYFGVVYQF